MIAAAPNFGLVAGEASGDLLAALLLDGLRQRFPGLNAFGIGGPRMAQQGFHAWHSSETLSVRGYLEVLPRLAGLLALRRRLGDRLLRERPDLFIGVDAPDFNFGLEARLKQAGIRTVHFVSPSFWAWRAKKLVKLKAAADHVLCIFPFEPELLERHGIAATYVGHPLAGVIPLEADRAAARERLDLRADRPVVALLPGSRKSEIEHHAFRFFTTSALVQRSSNAMQFIVPTLPSLLPAVTAAAHAAGMADRVKIVAGQSHDALAACDVTLIASGTATLEAALFKRPMVIAYSMNALSFRIMKAKALLPYVGLPNVLCGEFVVPELLQERATPEALAAALLDWLAAPEKIASLQQRFMALHLELKRDTATLATDAIHQVLER